MLHVCAGQYLYEEIRKRDGYEVAFVWNRSEEKMRGQVDEELILPKLANCASRSVRRLQGNYLNYRSFNEVIYLTDLQT